MIFLTPTKSAASSVVSLDYDFSVVQLVTLSFLVCLVSVTSLIVPLGFLPRRFGALCFASSSCGLSRAPSWPRPLTLVGFVVEGLSVARSESLCSVGLTLSVSSGFSDMLTCYRSAYRFTKVR